MKTRSSHFIFQKSITQALNVLLITSEEKSHYVFIKDFDSAKFYFRGSTF